MIFCHKCGAKAVDDAAFCRKCGARLILDDEQAEEIERAEVSGQAVKFVQKPVEEFIEEPAEDFSEDFIEEPEKIEKIVEKPDEPSVKKTPASKKKKKGKDLSDCEIVENIEYDEEKNIPVKFSTKLFNFTIDTHSDEPYNIDVGSIIFGVLVVVPVVATLVQLIIQLDYYRNIANYTGKIEVVWWTFAAEAAGFQLLTAIILGIKLSKQLNIILPILSRKKEINCYKGGIMRSYVGSIVLFALLTQVIVGVLCLMFSAG